MPSSRQGPRSAAAARQPANAGARRRNRDTTRSEILDAARVAFTNGGFDEVGVREIAADAQVTAALVNRYFGSKQELFTEAVSVAFDIRALLESRTTSIPETFASEVTRRKPVSTFDSTMATVRSAGSRTAAPLLREALEKQFIEPLAATIADEHAAGRAALIASLLMGFAITRDVLGVSALRRSDEEWTRETLRSLMERLMTDDQGES
jgi:AcrR family transcriptional regulator